MKRAALVFLLSVAILATIASPTYADNWSKFYLGYDRIAEFNKCNLTTIASDAFGWNDTKNVEPNSYISTSIYTTCTYEWEVTVYDNKYGDTSWLGRWYCESWSGATCHYGNVQFNLDKQPSSGWTVDNWRHLMCQEIGHSITLAHSTTSIEKSNSCMGGPGTLYLTSHDHKQLDNVWSTQP